MTTTQNALVLAGRILLAYLFITAGVPKLMDPSGTAGMIQGAGLPAATALAYLAGLFETATGIAILIGFQTKLAALALAAFSAFTAVAFHNGTVAIDGWPDAALGWINTLNGIMFVKNFALAGAFLILAAFGAGAWSVDGKRAAH